LDAFVYFEWSPLRLKSGLGANIEAVLNYDSIPWVAGFENWIYNRDFVLSGLSS
jgi:hypothetical protein